MLTRCRPKFIATAYVRYLISLSIYQFLNAD